MDNKRQRLINHGLLDYLSQDAVEGVRLLVSWGMDVDLAVAYLELHVPEEKVWDIPNEENLRTNVDTD